MNAVNNPYSRVAKFTVRFLTLGGGCNDESVEIVKNLDRYFVRINDGQDLISLGRFRNHFPAGVLISNDLCCCKLRDLDRSLIIVDWFRKWGHNHIRIRGGALDRKSFGAR